MKRRLLTLLISGIAAVVFGQIASAADLPRKAPVYIPPPPPVFTWQGFYTGLNVGGSWGRDEVNYYIPAGGPSVFNPNLSPDSFIVGGQIGYNWQMGSIVFGIEADIAWRHATDSAAIFFPNGIDATTINAEQNWVGTLRPRIGYAAQNWLLYATGGLAYGGFKHSYFENRFTVAGQNRLLSEDDTKAGWTVGGGFEWAFHPRLSLGVEYLYMKFDDTTLSLPAETVNGLLFPASSVSFTDSSQVVRAKLNYRF